MKSVIKQIAALREPSLSKRKAKRKLIMEHYNAREQFLAELRKAGVRKKKYSSMVAEWDRGANAVASKHFALIEQMV